MISKFYLRILTLKLLSPDCLLLPQKSQRQILYQKNKIMTFTMCLLMFKDKSLYLKDGSE